MSINLTSFILFFGIALLDALRGGHWLQVLFWLVLGAGFYLADRRGRAKRASLGRQEAGQSRSLRKSSHRFQPSFMAPE